MKRVLIIDDDPENLTLVSDMLRTSFEPVTASSGREGLLKAVHTQPDVILLDINMPEMDGFEVCQRLRDQPSTRRIPVIMLTTASSLDSRVKGLDLGADDYITKPFQVRELVARVNARLRRTDTDVKADQELELGNLKMNPKASEVSIEGENIHLTQMEYELLRYFLERPNQVIPRQKLLGDLWPDSVVTNRTVDTHMANLRKKIRKFNCPLNTIYGGGYILKAPKAS